MEQGVMTSYYNSKKTIKIVVTSSNSSYIKVY